MFLFDWDINLYRWKIDRGILDFNHAKGYLA